MSAARTVVEVLAAAALIGGGLLALVGALGLVRLPDVGARLQAGTKPQVLGLILVCLGTAPFMGGATGVATLALAVLFQLTTAPVLAQMVGRAAHQAGIGTQNLEFDELTEARDAAEGER